MFQTIYKATWGAFGFTGKLLLTLFLFYFISKSMGDR